VITAAAPSGVQHAIASGGSLAAVVTEVGATLRSFTVDDHEVIDGFDRDDLASGGRGQVLAPWPNRLEDGSYEFDGRHATAAWNEPERANAIHGLVRWLPWQLGAAADDAVELRCTLHPSPGYPWRLDLAVRYALVPGGLEVSCHATNRSASTAPFGVGFHPYVRAGGETIDAARLTVPASQRLVTDDRALPIGTEPVDGTPYDFRDGRDVAATVLDTGYTALDRDDLGRATVELLAERRVRVWMDASFPFVMVFTGDTLQPAARRRQGIAIEPMSCAPNAFRSGDGLLALDAGATWSGSWGIDVGGERDG
jgi:aldose 1-epimerase